MKKSLICLFLLGVTVVVPANAMNTDNSSQLLVDAQFLKSMAAQIVVFTAVSVVSGAAYYSGVSGLWAPFGIMIGTTGVVATTLMACLLGQKDIKNMVINVIRS